MPGAFLSDRQDAYPPGFPLAIARGSKGSLAGTVAARAILFGVSPTVKRIGPYRFFFFSNEGFEPRHIHVQDGRKLAKFWLDNIELAMSTGFAAFELRRLRALVAEHREEFVEKWDEYFQS